MQSWKEEYKNLRFNPNCTKDDLNKSRNIKINNLPKKFYRLRSLSDEDEIKKRELYFLEENKVWMSSPDSFNDKHDSIYSFRTSDIIIPTHKKSNILAMTEKYLVEHTTDTLLEQDC